MNALMIVCLVLGLISLLFLVEYGRYLLRPLSTSATRSVSTTTVPPLFLHPSLVTSSQKGLLLLWKDTATALHLTSPATLRETVVLTPHSLKIRIDSPQGKAWFIVYPQNKAVFLEDYEEFHPDLSPILSVLQYQIHA